MEEGSRRDGDEQSPDFPGGAANHLGSPRARRGEGSWDSWLSSRWTWPASDDGACVGQAVQRKRFELFLSFFCYLPRQAGCLAPKLNGTSLAFKPLAFCNARNSDPLPGGLAGFVFGHFQEDTLPSLD